MLSTKSFFVRFLREHELKIDVVNYTNFTLSLQSERRSRLNTKRKR